MAERGPGLLSRDFRLLLAVRYLRARRKQAFTTVVTVVSVLGVTVGVAALIIALALLTGFQEDIQGKIIGANAHVFVQPYGPYLDQPETLAAAVAEVPGVVATAPAVLATGLLEGRSNQPSFVNLKGVDAAAEASTTDLLDRMIAGSAEGLQPAPTGSGQRPGMVLGADLAEALFVDIGDVVKLTLHSPTMATPFGSGGLRIRAFDVVGIFEAGMYEYDSTWALIPLGEAQDLLELGAAASLLQVRVADMNVTEPIVDQLNADLGDQFFVMDWKRMNRAYFAALQLEKLALFVTISLIVGVAALNIVATLVLGIKDKQRDIGILMSLGAARRDILRVFMAQGLAVGLVGTSVGCLLGVATSWILDRYQVIRLEAQVYYLSYVPFHVRWQDFTTVCVMALVISFLATLYPAWRASRLDPVVSLRYE